MRRRLINGILAALVAALAATAWWLRGDDTGPAPLTDAEPGGVRAVELRFPRGDPEGPLRLQRGRDGWAVTHPIARPARDGRVVTLLAVLGARPDSCYAADEHDAARFGLATPRAVLDADGARVAFGDRAADGRRYVRSGGRLCLLADRAYPLVAGGLDALAAGALLRPGATPVRIETPAARAERDNPASPWGLTRGTGDPAAWAGAWRAARADGFALDPPQGDLGRIRVTTSDGETRTWRIAERAPDLVLVPADADYGLVIPDGRARALLEPPEGNRDRSAGADRDRAERGPGRGEPQGSGEQ